MQLSKFFLKDTLLVNSIKNLAQYMFGVLAFYLTFGHVDVFKAVIGGLAFLFCYSAVYPFNDLMDLEKDRKEKSKKKWKALARGAISKKDSISLLFLLLTVGVFFLTFLDGYFILIIALVLLLNFFHSSNLIRAKENFYTVSFNMYIIQFLKYISGWLALTNNLSSAPLLLVSALSTAYVGGYLHHSKGKIKRGMSLGKKLLLVFFTILGAGSYLASFFISRFKLPILTLTGIAITYMLFLRKRREEMKKSNFIGIQIKSMFSISLILIPCFASLLIPQIAKANRLLGEEVEKYRKNFSGNLPDSFIMEIKQLKNKTKLLIKSESIQEKIEFWEAGLSNKTKD